jgi:hypothetical protein
MRTGGLAIDDAHAAPCGSGWEYFGLVIPTCALGVFPVPPTWVHLDLPRPSADADAAMRLPGLLATFRRRLIGPRQLPCCAFGRTGAKLGRGLRTSAGEFLRYPWDGETRVSACG